jgi:hypothetical protein
LRGACANASTSGRQELNKLHAAMIGQEKIAGFDAAITAVFFSLCA